MWAVQGTVCGTASALPPTPTQCCGRRPDWPLPLSKRKFCKPQRPLWMCSLFRHHLFQQDNSCSGSPKASSFPKVIPQSFKKKKKKSPWEKFLSLSTAVYFQPQSYSIQSQFLWDSQIWNFPRKRLLCLGPFF